MNRVLHAVAAASVASMLPHALSAQQCYSPLNQCFSFAPPGTEIERLDTGLSLRSGKLAITGDLRLRMRVADTSGNNPYNTNHQEATRARVRMDYDVNENVIAVVEFNFSEVWAGSEGYSDAQPNPTVDGIESRKNFSGISQAYLQTEDVLGLDEKIRVGRSNFILANGLVLGSCDFLQYPGAFTGAWVSRNFSGHDVEVFMLDNYGPLQSQLSGGGERYYGATGRLNFDPGSLVETLGGFYLAGSASGDFKARSEDSWFGIEGTGTLPAGFTWSAQAAHRQVANGMDVSAYRIGFKREFENAFGGVLQSIEFTRTDSEGALQINPADFNTAGLLHQYGGAWRSDLDTNQLAFNLAPGCGIDSKVTFLTLDHDGRSGAGINRQLGNFEVDVLAGKELKPGVHLGVGYGLDNDTRQVGYMQLTVYF